MVIVIVRTDSSVAVHECPKYSVDSVDVILETEQWAELAAQASAAQLACSSSFSISGATSTLSTLYNVTPRRRHVMFNHVADRDESNKRARGMAGVAWMCTSGTSRKGGIERHWREKEAPFRLHGELHS